MNKSKNKKIIALLVVMAFISTASMIFTYWNTTYTSNTATLKLENNVTIGKGSQTTTVLTVSSVIFDMEGDALVPAGYTGAKMVAAATFTTNVKWVSSEGGSVAGAAGTLSVKLKSVTGLDVTGEDSDLFTITLPETILTGDAKETPVTITITMKEPKDAKQYELVAGKTLTFEFVFSVT